MMMSHFGLTICWHHNWLKSASPLPAAVPHQEMFDYIFHLWKFVKQIWTRLEHPCYKQHQIQYYIKYIVFLVESVSHLSKDFEACTCAFTRVYLYHLGSCWTMWHHIPWSVQQTIFTANIWTWHSRKRTGWTNNINDILVPLRLPLNHPKTASTIWGPLDGKSKWDAVVITVIDHSCAFC